MQNKTNKKPDNDGYTTGSIQHNRLSCEIMLVWKVGLVHSWGLLRWLVQMSGWMGEDDLFVSPCLLSPQVLLPVFQFSSHSLKAKRKLAAMICLFLHSCCCKEAFEVVGWIRKQKAAVILFQLLSIQDMCWKRTTALHCLFLACPSSSFKKSGLHMLKTKDDFQPTHSACFEEKAGWAKKRRQVW